MKIQGYETSILLPKGVWDARAAVPHSTRGLELVPGTGEWGEKRVLEAAPHTMGEKCCPESWGQGSPA